MSFKAGIVLLFSLVFCLCCKQNKPQKETVVSDEQEVDPNFIPDPQQAVKVGTIESVVVVSSEPEGLGLVDFSKLFGVGDSKPKDAGASNKQVIRIKTDEELNSTKNLKTPEDKRAALMSRRRSTLGNLKKVIIDSEPKPQATRISFLDDGSKVIINGTEVPIKIMNEDELKTIKDNVKTYMENRGKQSISSKLGKDTKETDEQFNARKNKANEDATNSHFNTYVNEFHKFLPQKQDNSILFSLQNQTQKEEFIEILQGQAVKDKKVPRIKTQNLQLQHTKGAVITMDKTYVDTGEGGIFCYWESRSLNSSGIIEEPVTFVVQKVSKEKFDGLGPSYRP